MQGGKNNSSAKDRRIKKLEEELAAARLDMGSITHDQELLSRNQQVEELYTYYEAILFTVQEPMLILDKDIRIKSANKSFYKIFHVTEDESIGISLFKLGNNQWNIPGLRELLEDIVPK